MIEFKVPCRGPIKLGHTGENEAVRVAFSLLPFKEAFPGGVPALLVRRKGDAAAYPVTLAVEGDTAYWTVTSADTEKAGFGQCELQWYLGDTLAKSDKFDFLVAQALEAGAEPPDEPSKRWFEALEEKIGDLSKLTTKAKENLVAAINEAAKTGSGGAGSIEMQVSGGYIQYSTDGGETWENLIAVEDLKGKDGEDGQPGTNGQDGYSPVAKVEATADGAKITITDKTGTTEAEVRNGKDGSPGADGAPGNDGSDGHTPVITAEKSGKVTTIKADGVTIATVNDGTDGTDGAPGAPGAKGDTGATPDIQIGTVTTLPAGSDATASMSGTAENPLLNLGIPKGADGASGGGAGGSPSSALICDITLAEAAQAVSQTLEHNFYALHCIVNCGTSGVALLVDADGASVSGKISLMLDTTVASYNIRKYGMINYNAAAWKSYAIHAIWSPDRTFFEQSQNEELSTGENATVYHSFGGITAMKGTLGADALSPDSGRTVNIVAGANTLLNAGVRVIIWGEYYE